jgi:hypothetical protein
MEKEASRQKKTNFHLAGIIPVASLPLDFQMPWHDSLMPLAPNYLAVERSVYECAMAGCETIWIVCHKETTPLIRHRMGDWILDPTKNYSILRKFYKRCEEHVKRIPIYYVPIHPKDRNVRDGLTWSIIYGYKRAYHISRNFSRWATPAKYFVSFPHGVYSPAIVKELRTVISSKQSIFLSTPDGRTAKDGERLAFTFDTFEYSQYRGSFLEKEKRRWKSGKWEDGKFIGEELPAEERFNGASIPLSDFLEKAKVTPQNTMPVKWYHDISSWQGYCNFLSSEEKKYIKRPKFGFKYHEFNPFAHDNPVLDKDSDLD